MYLSPIKIKAKPSLNIPFCLVDDDFRKNASMEQVTWYQSPRFEPGVNLSGVEPFFAQRFRPLMQYEFVVSIH